jgi:hypothetical protein
MLVLGDVLKTWLQFPESASKRRSRLSCGTAKAKEQSYEVVQEDL